jgi:hypothetical protein
MRHGQTLFGQDVVKSIGFNEGEILGNILALHCPAGFELDPCYSIGSFYDRFGIRRPKLKFDINPQAKGVEEADAANLPVQSGSIQSIMFDPPFLATSGPAYESDDNSSIITKRFSGFRNMDELWRWYSDCLNEFNRILKDGGVLVFKNQDTVSSAKQYFSHVYIMNEAVKLGFYPKDLFILLAKNRIIGGNHAVQYHARKFHCYYWVFEKRKTLVNYQPPLRG